MRRNACALRGIYSHDMMMKCDILIWKHHGWYVEWHNEMHVYASRDAYFHEMWCMIWKCYAWLCLNRHLFTCTLCTQKDDD